MEKTTPSIKRVMNTSTGLKRSMKTRDAIMVAVGGTIGTGIFLSFGDVLAKVGIGGAIIAYLFGGLVIWLMTACLGELCSAMPVAGGVQAYCTEYINKPMGITIGWINWLQCALTITAQVVASAIIMKNIFPMSPTALWIVLFTIILFGVNFFAVGKFGNISFYFSSLKIMLIVLFCIVGCSMIFFGVGNGGQPIGFKTIAENGGIFPVGIAGIGSVILSGFYAFTGTELIATTGGELKKEEDMPKIINWTLILIIAAYILSITIISFLLPWNQADLNGSPFAYVFRNAGMVGAELFVNIIVVTSALTSGNYNVYVCTRTLWSLAKFKQAPKIFKKTNKSGVPIVALCVSIIMGLIGIIAEYTAEDTVYKILIYLISGAVIFIYTNICLCQYRFRKRFYAEGGKKEDLKYRVLFPVVPILGIFLFLALLVISLFDPEEAVAFYICIPTYAIIYIASYIYCKKKNKKEETYMLKS